MKSINDSKKALRLVFSELEETTKELQEANARIEMLELQNRELIAKTRCTTRATYNSKSIKLSKYEIRKKENIAKLFNELWNVYDKKVGKKFAERTFNRLSLPDMGKCIDAAKTYVKATPNVTYRKQLAKWLSTESYNDEVK